MTRRIVHGDHPPNALIDIFMPEMDGFETAQRLRQQSERRGRTIRIWHITGMNSPVVEKRSAESGVMGLLLKPFSLVHLCQVLKKGLAAPVPPLLAPALPTRAPFGKNSTRSMPRVEHESAG